MRERLLLLVVGLLSLVPAFPASAFWQSRDSNYNISSGVVAYTGVLDIVSGATAYYALRAGSGTIAAAGTQKLVNIRRASDSETCDFIVATSGGIGLSANCSGSDNGETPAAFLASTNGFAAKIYDQSGNGADISQVTASAQPQLLLTGCTSGSLPCLLFNGSDHLAGTIASIGAQPNTASAVALNSGTAGTIISLFNTGSEPTLDFTAAGTVRTYAGSNLTASATAAVWHAIQGVNAGASSVLYIDGSSTSGNSGAGQNNTTIELGAQVAAAVFLNGKWAEGGWWSSAFSAGNQSSVNGNQHTYWGF